MIHEPGTTKFLDIRGLVAGWNVFDDSSMIADNEVAEVKNMFYDAGFLGPRKGSVLLTTRPDDEEGDPLQTIIAKTSDGLEYLIAVYDNHFYVFHDENEEWIRINMSYVPTETDLVYGWVNWNNGRGDDRLYGCNGVDDFFRWDVCVASVSGVHPAGSPTLTLDDATRFPNSGTVVIHGSSGDFVEAYSSKSGNVLTLTDTLNTALVGDEGVAMDMVQKGDMEIGKIVSKHQGRLFTMNYYGGETTVWFSVQADPEDFTTGSDIEDAGTEVISDGNGEIKGAHDFGEFLVIEKEDSYHAFKFVISDDLGSKLTQIVPILSGQSIGPLSQQSTIKIQNTLMYPTRTQGFVSAIPTLSGTNTGVNLEVLSQKIQPYVKNSLEYDHCRGIGFDQKAFWAVSNIGGSANIIIVVYDILRKTWTKIEGSWAVKDWAYKDKKLFYMENATGSIYQVLTGGYNDNNNPYLCEAYTKRFDFGVMATPKTQDLIYLQGYMTPMSDVFVDVLFNESGILQKQTYRLNKDTEGILMSDPITDASGTLIPGNVILGWVALQNIGNLSFFRCYLGIDISKGYYNLQCRIYQNKGAFFGITGMSHNPHPEELVPDEMVVSPITN